MRERERQRQRDREIERVVGGGGGGGGPDRYGRNRDKQLRRNTPFIDLEKDRKI